MLINGGFRSKEASLITVGAGHPEFTPLERGKSLDEGGSPQVGGGHGPGSPHVGGCHPVMEFSLVGGGQEETSGDF